MINVLITQWFVKEIVIFNFLVHVSPHRLLFWWLMGLFHVKQIFFKFFLPWVILTFEVIFEFYILVCLVNFFAKILKNLRFRLTVHVKVAKYSTIFGLFYLIAVERRLLTFFSSKGNSLFLLKHTFDFFIIKMS